MSQFIIQPNGKIARFSSITDSFMFLDATDEEAAEEVAKAAYEKVKDQCRKTIEELRLGMRVYPFRMSWKQAVRAHLKTCPNEWGKFKEYLKTD